MIAMLEEAEDVLRRAGCDMTAANIRKVLQAQQVEPRCACGDSFASDAVCANCLAAQQQAVAAPLPPFDVFSNDDGDSWETHPASDNFVHGLQLGEEFELLAGWQPERVTFRVTKVPDDESDYYEVEEVTAPAAQKGGHHPS